MQAYKAHFRDGRVVPLGNPSIPEGSELIITVLDQSSKNEAASSSEVPLMDEGEIMRRRSELSAIQSKASARVYSGGMISYSHRV